MKTTTLANLLRQKTGNLKTRMVAVLVAILLMSNASQACTNRAVSSGCFFIGDRNEVNLSIGINSSYWDCRHNEAVTGNAYLTYAIKLYDSAGNLLGTFPAQVNSNPLVVNIGSGYTPPFKFEIVETLVSSINNAVISVTDWGTVETISTKCEKPDPNEISACFVNDPQSIYTRFEFHAPPGLYAYCLANNVTPVLYVINGSTTIGPIAPASFNYLSLTYNVFPHLDPNTCYQGGLVFRNNTTGVEDASAYWLSSNNSANSAGYICNCVTCDAGFKADQHLHDVSSTDVTFLSYNPGAIASESYSITGANGATYTNNGTTSILLANGTYTVCHTVITKTKERCTICRVLTITGDNGDPSDPSGPLGKMITDVSVSPNPSSDISLLIFALSGNSLVEIQLLNAYGNNVKTLLERTTLESGRHELKLNSSVLQDGLYTIRISTDGEVRTIYLMVRH